MEHSGESAGLAYTLVKSSASLKEPRYFIRLITPECNTIVGHVLHVGKQYKHSGYVTNPYS